MGAIGNAVDAVFGKNKPPKPPDMAQAAQDQAASSFANTRYQTYANRPSQVSPWGSVQWTATPQGEPDQFGNQNEAWSQTVTLDPRLQAALNSQMDLTKGQSDLALSLLGTARSELGQPLDWNSFTPFSLGPAYQSLNTNADKARSDAEAALYGRATGMLDPQMSDAENALDIKLQGQGVRPGDEAYDRAMSEFQRNKAFAYDQARQSAIVGGGEEAQRQLNMAMGLRGQDFGQQMALSQLQNQVRGSEIAQELQRRGYSINEISALLSGSQVSMPNMPGFAAANAAQSPNLLGAAGIQTTANNDFFSAQQAQNQGALAGLVGLGKLGFSFF